jgi:hypothetical protein
METRPQVSLKDIGHSRVEAIDDGATGDNELFS